MYWTWVVLAFVWTLVFLPNMVNKDRRMSRHPGFAEYKARTGLLLPRLLPLSTAPSGPTVSGPHRSTRAG